MLYFIEMTGFNKMNLVLCNLTNYRLKSIKLNTILDESY